MWSLLVFRLTEHTLYAEPTTESLHKSAKTLRFKICCQTHVRSVSGLAYRGSWKGASG